MRIPQSKIDQVAAAADIVQVISQYVDLKRAGKDYRGLCPFHGDNDPSFYVSPHKGIFYCFGCAAGGSVFNFLMRMESISFVESVRMLAERFGIDIHFERGVREGASEKAKLLEVVSSADGYFREQLAAFKNPREYLYERGIAKDWITQLGFGFAPDSWDGVLSYLRKSGADLRAAVSAGIVKPGRRGSHYDYFRARIMIPIRDLNGTVCAFGGRIFGEGDPKYLNSPESAVFSKKRLLYGLDSAKEAIRREGFVVLVEGYFDQISLRIRGMENVVAPLGTALGREQIRIVKRFTGDVVTVFDGDEAGVRALKRAIPLFLSEGIEPRGLILKGDKDPDEVVRREGIDGFRRMLEGAVPAIDFFLENLGEVHDLSTLQGRQAAVEECLPVLREIADSTGRDYLIERSSARLRVREERIRGLLKSSGRRGGQSPKSAGRKKRSLYDLPADERNILRGMLLREGFIDQVYESGMVEELREPTLRGLAEKMIEFRRDAGSFDSFSFCKTLEDEEQAAMVAGWLQPRREEDDLGLEGAEMEGDLVIDHSIRSIRLRRIRERMAEIKERISRCTPGEEEYNRLGQELFRLGRSLGRG